MLRILVSTRPPPHRLPLSISGRVCISSISAPSNAHLFFFKPRGSSPNSSLAVNSGPNNNIENILSNESANRPSNDSPEKDPSQDRTDHLTPLRQYQKLIDSGVLLGDDHQTRIIQKLQDLHDELLNYDQPIILDSSSNSYLSRFFSRESPLPTSPPESAPKGLYLYGDVGTGKTMLMDLFYQTLPPSIQRKRRIHFHAFMYECHKRMHVYKTAVGLKAGDLIIPIAKELARSASVLCFDEFQVTDIADAMLLRRLLESLVNLGVVCVMTSNRHPDDLYKNGIQRSSFLPAIDLLKSRFEVTDLNSGTDYRRIPRAISHVYFDPITPQHDTEINKIFKSLTSEDPLDPPIRNRILTIWGRSLLVPESTSKVAKFNFNELCGHPLSAADYIELTKNFAIIFLLNVPKMTLEDKDMARRFITFIDACYESKTKLFVTSEVPIYKVFSDDDSSSGTKQISDHMRSVMDDLGLSNDVLGTSSVFTGEEEVFAFARACSRLIQMGSKEWAEMAGQHSDNRKTLSMDSDY